MGTLDGKVALVTGAARGQGRNHALRMAEQGADIIAVDICKQMDTVPYPLATPEDLAETVRLVEAQDRRIVAREADVRDYDGLKAVVDEGVAELGRLDIIIPNAGIVSPTPSVERTQEQWHESIDVMLTGVWNTVRGSVEHVRAHGEGGSIVFISSVAGILGLGNIVDYVAAKHGVLGMMKTLANELGPERIRVNAVCPTNVDTDMVQNPTIRKLFLPDLENPTREDCEKPDSAYVLANAIPVPWIDIDDVTNVILFLVADTGRYITGAAIPVDAGFIVKKG